MQRTLWPGFWVLEGLDGSGTTTLLKGLAARAQERQTASLWTTFEPTDGILGRLIRQRLGGQIELHPGTLAALFAADRWEHLYGAQGIWEHLQSGKTVVSDRYIASSLAYQSLDTPLSQVLHWNALFPRPERMFFLDTPLDLCFSRRQARAQAEEIYEAEALQKRLSEGYERALTLLEEEGVEIIRLDGRLAPEALVELAWERLKLNR